MIHVDLKRDTNTEDYVIEVSCDGARFVEHWRLPAKAFAGLDGELLAQSVARIYASGIKFGGGDVRMTAFGGAIHMPDMTTIRVH